MSSSSSPSGKSGGYTVGLSTARFLDQAMLDEVAPTAVPALRPAPTPPPPPAPVPPIAATKASERNESDEEISSYMSQLLKRTGQAPAGGTPNAPPPAAPVSSHSSAAEPSEGHSESAAEEEAPWTEAQYIPKKLAPEREADLRAFRKLANASARGALNSFEQKKQRKQCKTSGFLAVSSLVAAIPLYLWGGLLGDHWGASALAALVIGGVFGYRFHKSRGGLEK
ncbi:MAG: hypothetical protein ACK6DS_15635 [Planctomycetota bacterium]